ncbi:MAG: DUF835 domain-containing protein [Euryarchaeota archaeon]|nr:DUF835 domain-containing protein [Euryarchaeota archaeon]
MDEERIVIEESELVGESPAGLPERGCVVVEEEKPRWCVEAVRGLVDRGSRGLVITRMDPREARRLLGGGEVLYLGMGAPDGVSSVARLDEVVRSVRSFVSAPGRSVVLLDGLEYLVHRHTFAQALKLVQDLSEMVLFRGALLVVPVSPRALEAREMALLEREAVVVRPAPAR